NISENEEDNKEEQEIGTENDDVDTSAMIKEVEELTDGKAKIIYENNDPQIHEEEAYSISLDAYTIAELTDFHAQFTIPFDSEEEGAVLITHFTIENKTSEEIAYTPNWSLMYSGADRYPGPNRDVLPEEEQIAIALGENEYTIEPNEKVTGYYAFVL